MGLKEEKSIIRKRLLSWRKGLSASDRDKWSHLIMDQVLELPEVKQANTILCYQSFGNEVDTTKLIRKLQKAGKQVHFPIFDETSQTYVVEDPESIDVAICPGIGFDRNGNRLGFGKGNFDRLLKTLPSTTTPIGLAYSQQIVENIPREPHDIAMDLIVTEKGTITSSRIS